MKKLKTEHSGQVKASFHELAIRMMGDEKQRSSQAKRDIAYLMGLRKGFDFSEKLKPSQDVTRQVQQLERSKK